MPKYTRKPITVAVLCEPLASGRDHLTSSGTFQSDKYPGCPPGKVPLSVRDPLAQELLWEYARRHAAAKLHGDSEFSRDLYEALGNAGFKPGRAKAPSTEPRNPPDSASASR